VFFVAFKRTCRSFRLHKLTFAQIYDFVAFWTQNRVKLIRKLQNRRDSETSKKKHPTVRVF